MTCLLTHSLTRLFSHTVSPHTHVIPVYSHSLSLTSLLRELVLPLTLSHTVSSLTHIIPVNTPMVPYYHQVCSLCSLPCVPIPCVLTHPHPPILVLPHTSFHLILTHNPFPHTPHHPTTLPHDFTPSCLHHIIIASSPLHHLNHHQSLPITTNHLYSLS